MISRRYVAGESSVSGIYYKRFTSFLERVGKDIDNEIGMVAVESYRDDFLNGYMTEASIGRNSDSGPAEAKKSVFAKVGNAVIEIFRKLIALIDSLIAKIRGIGFSSKTDMQKLDILIREHPELKDEAIAAVNSGALELSDMKNIKELNSAFEEIMRMNADPNTLRGKWEAAKKKFGNIDKSTVVKAAAAATTIITAVIAIRTFSSKIAKSQDELNELRRKEADTSAKVYKRLTETNVGDIRTTPPGSQPHPTDDPTYSAVLSNDKITGLTGILQCKLAICREKAGISARVATEHATAVEQVQNGIAAFLDKCINKVDKNATANYHARMGARYDAIAEREILTRNLKEKLPESLQSSYDGGHKKGGKS